MLHKFLFYLVAWVVLIAGTPGLFDWEGVPFPFLYHPLRLALMVCFLHEISDCVNLAWQERRHNYRG